MSDLILFLWNGIGPNKGTSAYLLACFFYLYLSSNLKNPKILLCCWENLALLPCNKFSIRANFWGTLHMSEFFFVCSFRKETRVPNPLNLFCLGLLPNLPREVIMTWSILQKHRKIGSTEKKIKPWISGGCQKSTHSGTTSTLESSNPLKCCRFLFFLFFLPFFLKTCPQFPKERDWIIS